MIDLGIKSGAEALDGVKALLIFGEDTNADLSNIEFLMVCDTHMTNTARKADVIFPSTSYASTEGTYTNTERRLQRVSQVIEKNVPLNNWEIASKIAHIYEVNFEIKDTNDISDEMKTLLPKYKYAKIGEVLGGALVPIEPKFVEVKDTLFVEPLQCTDNLMNIITEKLPKPAKA